jgi:DNA repair ATPase RecN
MPTNHSELVGTTGKGGRRRKGRVEDLGASVEKSAQQLEQAQISIAKIYQENRELQHQLAVKTQRIPSPQGRMRSIVWLQRQHREAQDTIMKLRKAHRMVVTMEHKTAPSTKDNLREDQSIGDT